MMVPRAYHYVTAPLSRSPSPTKREKNAASRAKPKPTSNPPPRSKSSSDRPSVPTKLGAVSPATPSKPVVIPTRTQSSQGRRIPKLQQEGSSDTEPHGHDRNAIPPSMAALLAITSIPRPKTLARRKKGSGRRTDAEMMSADEFRQSPSAASPKSWTILQSSPGDYDDDDDDDDGRTEKSMDGATDASSIMSGSAIVPSSFRSMSSDSLPSLDVDLDCDSAQSFSPPSPGQRLRHRGRRVRESSPAVPVSSDSEHPLATASFPDSQHSSPSLSSVPEDEPSKELFAPATSSPSTSFKSNLTASLRLLRSAAKVLSSPTRLHDPTSLTITTKTTSTPPATQAVVESPFTPKSADFFLSNNIDALPFHLSAQLPGPPPTMSIQLQPCQTSPLSTPTATAPPIFLSSSKSSSDEPEIKPFQREPRENSDFLRVVVLEMNMRRAGKLSGEGRARIWLGARQQVALDTSTRSTAGIADGGAAHGAVVLDGEVGEAQEVEAEIEHPHPHPHQPLHEGVRAAERHHRRPATGRSHRTPRRWVPIIP